MDANYINPFIEAVDSVFATMLHVSPKREAVRVSASASTEPTVTSLIGISGQVSGVVALRFPPATALRFAGRMLGAPYDQVNDEVVDAISEIVNMVAGSAKARLVADPPLELGLPTVVDGVGYKLKYPSKSVWLEVAFTSDDGPFSMEVTYHPN